ncbi:MULTISPECIES: hypothetical protein [Halomonadaceae]|uniref:hypothetical protein n=1 Tax=Halomonadaceae TaxID=28256 RepID=UPI00159758B6|nr:MULTISPECIES: hypothetical protein [Halomonas]QJQ96037.1 hypothetical protein HIO72_12660 [Halomonas sp. PA5]
MSPQPAEEPVSGLTETLAAYQGAVAARTEFLNDNTDNELLVELGDLGEEPTAAEVATAIEQANTVAQNAVETAEDNLQDAIDALDVARATTATQAGVEQAAIDALTTLSANTLLRDATLEAARAEAQAAVDADERLYDVQGNVIVNGDTVTEPADHVVLYTDADGNLTIETDDGEGNDYEFAGIAVEKFANDNEAVTAADVLADGSAWTYVGLETDNTEADNAAIIASIFANDSIWTSTDAGPNGNGTYTAEIDGETYTAVITDSTDEDGTGATLDSLEDANGDAATWYLDVEGNLTAEPNPGVTYTEADLVDLFTAAELQQAIVDAEDALAAHVNAEGDYAALLDAVRDAINAHIGAGGANVELQVNDPQAPEGIENPTLLNLRDVIVDVIDGEEVDQALVANLINFVAGYGNVFAEPVEEDAADLTAQQQAVNAAFGEVEERTTLESAVSSAEDAFDATVTGEILNIVLELQAERQALIDAIETREAQLEAAEETAEATQALVDKLETLETDIEDALAMLKDSEEDGGFGVTLGEFAPTPPPTATCTSLPMMKVLRSPSPTSVRKAKIASSSVKATRWWRLVKTRPSTAVWALPTRWRSSGPRPRPV